MFHDGVSSMVTGGVLITAVYLNGKGRIADVLETLNVVGATETLGRGRGTRRAAGVICPHYCIPRYVHARICCALQFCWNVAGCRISPGISTSISQIG